MLAKLTSKNQLTLPKKVISDFPGTLYFDVAAEGGRIVLTPMRVSRADSVRAKLAAAGAFRIGRGGCGGVGPPEE